MAVGSDVRRGDLVRFKYSPEVVWRVEARQDDSLLVNAMGPRRNVTGWFLEDQLELVPGQEEVFEA